MATQTKSRFDIHQSVTDKIIQAIENGAAGDNWQMPWHRVGHRPGIAFSIPKNALTGKNYRGINILALWIDGDEKRFATPLWATYKQWIELGAQVRAGEKASLIVKYGQWVPKGTAGAAPQAPVAPRTSTATPGDGDGIRGYAKAAYVFNVDQVDHYPRPGTEPLIDRTERMAVVDAFVANTNIEIREGGDRAYYRQPTSRGEGDYVQLPPRATFIGTKTSTPTESYEATRLHEILHATGAKHRLDRQFGKRFGDNDYAFEELLVEIGAATLCCTLGVTNEPRDDHSQYIKHWLTILKSDNRAIFTAAAAASRAIDYLYTFQPKTTGTDILLDDDATE